MAQSIYVIWSENGHVKVGITGNVAKRIAALRVGAAARLHLTFCREVAGDARVLERKTHSLLKGLRLHGEWFSATPEAATGAITQAANFLGFGLIEPAPIVTKAEVRQAQRVKRDPSEIKPRRSYRKAGRGTAVPGSCETDSFAGMMTHRGYSARVEYDDADGLFFGRVAGINDVVGFHADDVAGLRAAFRDAVDDYLETCAKAGKAPEREYSGKVMFRVDPGLHARVAKAAELAGLSINQWGEKVLADATS